AVVPGGVAAPGALLRGMPGVDPDHRTTPGLRLVRYERPALVEGPAVDAARLLPFTRLDAAAGVRQIFDDDRRARPQRLGDPPAQAVLEIAAEPPLFASDLFEVTLSAFGPLPLQRAAQFEASLFDVPPAFLTKERRFARHGRLRQSEIDPDDGV